MKFNFLEDTTLLSPAFMRLWGLLALIFAGVIVGENACEALLVTHFGYAILPKMYMGNSLMLLMFLPIVFLFIDRIERGKFLKIIVISFSCLIFFVWIGITIFPSSKNSSLSIYSILIASLYLFSYLFKIILFLIFWTLANDVSNTRQSKAVFPLIASGGILGGLIASLTAKAILKFSDVNSLILLWPILIICSLPIIKSIRVNFNFELQHSEFERKMEGEVFAFKGYLKTITGDRLIRLIAVMYFLIFVIIFGFDFQFAKVLNKKFPLLTNFADFRYNFYIVHSLTTAVFQWAVAGLIIKRFGIISTMSVLPLFFISAFALLWYTSINRISESIFYMVVVLQFFRQVLFECFFSPNYQVFFSSLKKEIRGRAKVFLEGIVKPLAIFTSGALLYLAHKNDSILFLVLLLSAILFAIVLYFIRNQYIRSLLEGVVGDDDKVTVISKNKDSSKKDILSWLNECVKTKDADLKRFAITGFVGLATREAFLSLKQLYELETTDEVKENIAKSLGDFFYPECKIFLINLCNSNNSRIIANALYSLRNSEFKDDNDVITIAENLLNHEDVRIEVEASILLWSHNRLDILTKIENNINEWIESDDENKEAAAVYLIGQIHNISWLPAIWKSLHSEKTSIWTKSIDVLANFDSPEAWKILAEYLLITPRQREDRIIRALSKLPPSGWAFLQDEFLKTKKVRSLFALIEVMRRMAVYSNFKTIELREPVRKKIKDLLIDELKKIYSEFYSLNGIMQKYGQESIDLLTSAVNERRNRIAIFLYDMVSLLDSQGQLLLARHRFNDRDPNVKSQLTEMIDSTLKHELSAPLILLLETDDIVKLAEFAEKKWEFSASTKTNYEKNILESPNNWVRSVAIFTLKEIEKKSNSMTSIYTDLIKTKTNDRSVLVSKCANEFIEDRG